MVEVDGERTLQRVRSCRADVADLVANLGVLVESQGLDTDSGHDLRGAWADEFRPALGQLTAALDAVRAELEQRRG